MSSTPRFLLRDVRESDEPFLYRLFAGTHGQQFALLPLEPAALEGLVRMQFNAQRQGYRLRYPQSQEYVIAEDEQPSGRVWLNENPSETRVIDISIVPEQQGRGLGTAVLRGIIETAASVPRPVRLYVDRMNVRAARLYSRLGFRVCAESETGEEMEFPPPSARGPA